MSTLVPDPLSKVRQSTKFALGQSELTSALLRAHCLKSYISTIMKHMKPVKLALREPLPDGYRLMAVADQWSELLPEKIPLRYAIFRCVIACLCMPNGSSSI